ncbi:hypothetical protein [Acetobacter pasteurianus]|uniref:DUF2141 domain-containing protein n=1 Tax=Acetobacter pasteurianus NBRC 3188 TaxID=1226663 RepID=A0A401WUP2_ACEPA|nr:hypothetical protein [Acetobacter pasteurianus]GCD53068.1 hypothetical protein NBRC3188_1765 [Acetobacter pasteurianus NBRC 3188]
MNIIKISIFSLLFIAIPLKSHAEKIEFINVSISKTKKPKVTIKTNLPEGMEIAIDINKVGGGYADSYNGTVRRGEIITDQFSQNGSDLPPGQYMVMILSSGAQFEPDPIQKIIGENGEKLLGPDVKESTMGVGNVIDKRVFFDIP